MLRYRNYLITAIIGAVVTISGLSTLRAQIKPVHYQFSQGEGRIISNGIVDIVEDGSRIWFGTSKGLMMTPDNGSTFQFFDVSHGLGKGSISALAVKNGVVWAATAFDSVTSEGDLSVGGGLAYSEDSGQSWNYINQPVDPREGVTEYQPTTTTVQNVTYDIALQGDTVWISSWGGGLRKSTDKGKSWSVNPPDNLPFDALQFLNHRAFSVISAENGLWVGTSGGINKSTDGGKSWTHYTATNGSGISGNFVTALGEQRVGGGESIIWAATWKAEGTDEVYGVSVTRNQGFSWEVVMEGSRAHNFGFHENEAYVADDFGLWKSDDFGKTWAIFPPVSDNLGHRLLTNVFNGANFIQDYLWAGTSDGLVRTPDNGGHWDIFRAYQPTSTSDAVKTYAYPNPFSPSRHNVLGMDGHVRIQYSTTSDTKVTVTIYDFALKRVATVVEGESRFGGREYAEAWNGKSDRGDQVANGVYFYKLDLSGQDTHWGKIVVID